MHKTDTVIANALAEVAACKALRERTLARRAEAQRQIETPRPVYVLAHKKAQMELPLQ
ncbi:hypothetical protein [Mycoplana sp. MJR14]|jgi:hypothetical protein|uniref:hypothetical protein n=1 Tax=Mycoplana sp. MJR14 TaxID=3032583 RepID=UPI0013AF8CBE|nr:hypothetical protein [Mycoplana sp. MJR14]MDF1631523.1 hypothetical protein [Mycoplana sp. MJR14]